MKTYEMVAEAMERVGVSQKELSEIINTDQATMSKLMTGKRLFTRRMLERVAGALEADADELVGEDGLSQQGVKSGGDGGKKGGLDGGNKGVNVRGIDQIIQILGLMTKDGMDCDTREKLMQILEMCLKV